MRTIEAIATVTEDGTITARGPRSLPVGEHRVVIVVDEATAPVVERGLGEMAAFRRRLGAPTYDGNTVLEMREEERS